MDHVLVGEQMNVTVKPTRNQQSCAFCGGNHRYTKPCPKREKESMTRCEYILRADQPMTEDALKNRLRCGVPVTVNPVESPCYRTVERKLMGASFVIHEVTEVSGKVSGCIESCNYCVSFFTNCGDVDKSNERVWVNGDLMLNLVTHKTNKKKFVFDETIKLKPGWRERLFQSQTMSQIIEGKN